LRVRAAWWAITRRSLEPGPSRVDGLGIALIAALVGALAYGFSIVLDNHVAAQINA
jgi:hypothetical protein